MSDIKEIFDSQVSYQGVGCIVVSDGVVLCLPVKALEDFLEKARSNETQKVVVFVKHQVLS